ncbi:MAG: hypothetical protein EOM46_19405 [Gammaproteobacteria bacterium]|uniref:tRNA A-37 threonylcarbamoyl transferase component Bud32 n=1 Tax=Tolumonas osonensis TaxID=675874 RepID=A0A841GP67_9GAMM|nr:lipopolysaccharide kinase InaA family protein [Tolumonas osonensis]MBB6056911.1 tRNA A-37 threonylcarbamoyl transferase component Bud32 [Tolumonas osonensis]NCB59594.1 hypothetical protein [Gammaproteobacteria bacterium]
MFVVKFINNEANVVDSFIAQMNAMVRNDLAHYPDTFRMIKITANRAVYCYSFEQRVFYIKLYFFSNPLKYFKHLFRYSHGIHGYKKSIRLLNENVSTATPVLAMSYLGGLRSLVVHEAIPGVDAEEFFIKNSHNQSQRYTVLKKIGALIAELFSKGFSHGDMNFGGFIVDVQDEKISVSLIDVDNITNKPQKQFRDIVNLNAHLFMTAKKAQVEMLSNDELKAMYLSVLSIYNFGMTDAVFFEQLNLETEQKLIRWGQKGYIAI